MAWIKMRTDLEEDPAVISIAADTNLLEVDVVGRLHRLWSWADNQTYNGNADGVTPSWVDRHVGTNGFADAMSKVGWIIFTDKGMHLPNFERHNGETAKARALTAKRVAKTRNANRNADDNANRNADTVTKVLPEKRREEENIKARARPGGAGGESNAAVTLTPLQVAIVKLWPIYARADEAKELSRLLAEFTEIGATAETLTKAKVKADRTWTSPGGPDSILKHFAALCPRAEPRADAPPSTPAIDQEKAMEIMAADRKRRDEYLARNGVAVEPPGETLPPQLTTLKGKGSRQIAKARGVDEAIEPAPDPSHGQNQESQQK